MICLEDLSGYVRFLYVVFFVFFLIFYWGFYFFYKMFYLIVKGYLFDVLVNCYKRCLDVIVEFVDFFDVLFYD